MSESCESSAPRVHYQEVRVQFGGFYPILLYLKGEMPSLKDKGGDARAGDAERIELPEDRDDSMEWKRQGEKRSPPEEAAESPTKRQGHLSVDVETLRSLLAEQSAAFLEKVMTGQKNQLDAVASELRGEMQASEASVC